jgi:hypothetical protein
MAQSLADDLRMYVGAQKCCCVCVAEVVEPKPLKSGSASDPTKCMRKVAGVHWPTVAPVNHQVKVYPRRSGDQPTCGLVHSMAPQNLQRAVWQAHCPPAPVGLGLNLLQATVDSLER